MSQQTRLAELYAERVKVKDLEAFLEPIFVVFRAERKPKEAFGDFMSRFGFPAVKEFQAGFKSGGAEKVTEASKAGSLNLDPATLKALEAAASAQGKTLNQFLTDATKTLAGAK